MKKILKRFIVMLSVIIIGGVILAETTILKTEAATPLFTLGTIPTVEHEVTSNNSVNVNNITEYIDAINNPSVDQINFTANITADTTGQAMGLSVNRDLHINGNGFTLTIAGNSSFGPAGSGTASGTHLALEGTGGTLHLENLRLNRSTVGSGQNDFISIMTDTNQTWDIIFDNFTSDFSSNQWRSITRSLTGPSNSTRIFLRNNTNLNLGSGETVFATNGAVVAESNSIVNLTARSTSAIQGLTGGETKLYVAPNSDLTLGLPPQIWSGNRGTLLSVFEVNIYSAGSLNLVGTGNASTPALTSLDSAAEMVFKIDSDASLKIANTAGPAIMSKTGFPIRILGNPDSILEVSGTDSVSAVQMSYGNSEIYLSAPRFYNIQNNGTGTAFSGTGSDSPNLKLEETNIAVWLKGQSLSGNPQAPSPFVNASLFTGSTGALPGSSPIVNDMAGGWNTFNYRRISYFTAVQITAEDMSIGLGRTQEIHPQTIPTDATLSYVSTNPSIATVDEVGNVTGVAVGTTTITINGIGGAGIYPGSTTISVTVTNNEPVLEAPTFTVIPLGDTFSALYNVTATDHEDGNLIGSVQVDNPVDTNAAGVYVVHYTLTDFNSNTVSAQQVVLVQDDNFVVGNDTIIQASDFTKRISEVDIDPAAIKAAAQVKVYDKLTGLELVNEPVTIIEDSGYSATVNTYPITFEVDQDDAATITIDANVVTGEIPVLNVDPLFMEIELNQAFDETTGVSATDAEDGNITANIVVDNPVDTSVAGVYAVKYTITDSNGNSVSKTRTVLVQDDNFVVGTNTIIQASDFTKRISEVDTDPASIKAAAQVRVYDKLTGLELVNEPVTIIEDSGYSATVNTYPITFEVDQDDAATITIDANVVTGEIPVLNVDPLFMEIELNQAFDETTGVSATDAEDGDITSNIVIDNPVDTSVAGVYPLKYSATDSDGNTISLTRVVLVQDSNFAVGNETILSANDFKKRVGQVDTDVTAIKEAANVKVYDKFTGEELVDESVNVTNTDGYTSVVKDYSISFQVARDSQASKTITASVITGELPVIILPEAFTEIQLNDSFNPMQGVTVNDTEDGDLKQQLVVVGEVDVLHAGVYTLTYQVQDSDNNVVSVKRVILVNDGQADVGNQYIISGKAFTKRLSEVNMDETVIKNAAQIKVYDKQTGLEIYNQAVEITDLGGYSAVPGDYQITFALVSDSEAKISINATVLTDTPPKLVVPKFAEINIDDKFDPEKGVSASDYEDGNITSLITFNNTVNSNKAGIYIVAYEVIDSDKNKVSAIQTVLVNDGTFSQENGYIIQARDFEIALSKAELSDREMIELAGVRVFNIETQTWISNPSISVDSTHFKSKTGKYIVTFTYNPSISITITVYDDRTDLPETGNSSNAIGFSGLLLLAGSTLLFLRRKEKQN